MDGFIGPLTKKAIDSIIKEVRKKHNKEKIMEHIVDPFLKDIASRYYPHFITITAILIIIVILLFALVIMMIINRGVSEISQVQQLVPTVIEQ